MATERMPRAVAGPVPKDLILEPNEHVLLATRPLFLWEPLVLLVVGLIVASLYFYGASETGTDVRSPQLETLSYVLLAVGLIDTSWLVFKWIPWSRKWFADV